MNTWLIVIVFTFTLAVFMTAAWAGIIAAPWLPTRKKDVERALEFIKLRPDDTITDLGCGDGRILTEAVKKYQVNAVGYEISILNFLWSWFNSVIANLKSEKGRTLIRLRNFFKEDLSQYSVIFSYLTPNAMKKLSVKYKKELKPGTRIVSFAFQLPDFQPVEVFKEKGRVTIYLYKA